MLIVDRIEDNIVIVENDEQMETLDINLFDYPVKEGDVIVKSDEFYAKDEEATALRRKEILEKMKKLGLR